MYNFKNKKQKGFTLIELVIVIVILGILATIAGVRYSNMTQTTEDGVAKANLRTIKSAVTMAAAKNLGKFPTESGEVSSITDLTSLLEKDAYSKPNGYTYTYSCTDGKTYDLTVVGGGLPATASVKDGTKYTEDGND